MSAFYLVCRRKDGKVYYSARVPYATAIGIVQAWSVVYLGWEIFIEAI